jgi:dTDP-4-dehydrorhamnose reductase
VINAAAYTSVDAAESETAAAWRLNAQAPGYLAAVTARSAIPLLHLSSDFVFGGIASAAPHRPTDECSPLNVYGASKAAGERAIRSMNQRHIILRTSWVVSPYRANFVKTILRLAVTQPLLKVVDDQRGRPTSAIDLAAVVQSAALGLMRAPDSPIGTYHFANSGETTWLEIARAVVAKASERNLCRTVVDGIGSHEYNSPARRPANSVLCTESLERDFGITPRDWKAALTEILDELLDDIAFNVAHPKMAARLLDVDTR